MKQQMLRAYTAKPVLPPISPDLRLVVSSIPSNCYTLSHELGAGTQAKLIRAARFSQTIKAPLNAALTINAAHMQRMGHGGVFEIGRLYDGFRAQLELIRKWITARGIPWAAIWAREYTGGRNEHHGEHWHIALHLPLTFSAPFADQVARWTGEAIDTKPPAAGVAAVSALRGWMLSTKAGRGGAANIGAYLGKAESNFKTHYGKRVANTAKPRRDLCGGSGPIEGKRCGISKPLGKTAQAHHAA